jgi:plastocyanin
MTLRCAFLVAVFPCVALAEPSPDPVAERAQAIGEASSLLQKAGQAKGRGNRNFAEQLFSSAELILGPEALAELAPLFREGAPPRIATPLKVMPKDAPPQPSVAGSSDEEDKTVEKPKRGSLSGSLTLAGKPLDGRGVVTLTPWNGKSHARPPRTRVMEQRNREFAPKMMAIPVGSTVQFPNFDTIYHNVFSRSDAQPFDLGIYKNGQSRELVFEKEGIIRLGCNLHANMSAYIVVVGAPHYAITNDKGQFNFKSLEPGKYRLRAWSEKTMKPQEQAIEISADKNSVTVPLPADAPAASTDKFGAPRGK